MAQIFPEKANKVPLMLVIGVVVGGALATLLVWYYFSPWYTDVGYQPVQPVPYSHKLHAGDMKLDCRYCHVGVEVSAVASVPPTQVCMNCHRLVGQDKASLEPLRQSFSTGDPMRWVRVHKLPDFAYFDHSMHIRAGVGCSTCHGDVRSMEVITQSKPLSMGWCLQCHRNPAPYLRRPDQITNTEWKAPPDQMQYARRVIEERHIRPPVACTGCHR